MRATVAVLRWQLRRHWRSWLALAALVALVSGSVLALAMTARRTAAAFPGFIARHGYDDVIYSGGPLPSLASLPEVAQVTPAPAAFLAAVRCPSCAAISASGSADLLEVPQAGLSRLVTLVAGRMPDQSSSREVLASYTFATDSAVRVGSVISLLTPTARQLQLVRQGKASPAGLLSKVPRHAVRVVGLVAAENEFPSGNGKRYDVFATRALADQVNRQTPRNWFYYVRLRRGAAGQPGFESRLKSLGAPGMDDLDVDAAAVQRAIRPQAAGWWALAGLTALAGLAVAGQAAARQFGTDSADRLPLSALGLRVPQFIGLGLARAAIIGLAGAAGAVGLAAALSPLTPVGEARLAAGRPGAVAVDPLIAVIGAVATVITVMALSAWPAVRHARLRRGDPPPAGPAALVRAVARAGAPPSMLIGVRHAVQRGRGPSGTPVVTALLGVAMAVTALCGTAVFGASLSRLLSSPALYGVPFQAVFSNPGIGASPFLTGRLVPALRRDPGIGQITLATTAEASLNGRPARVLAVTAIRGGALISRVDGRLPGGDRDIVLGDTTMRQLGTRPGSLVRLTADDPLTGARHTALFRVTGRASFPARSGTGGLGSGAAITVHGLLTAQCPAGSRAGCLAAARRGIIYDVLVRAAPGRAGAAALARYTRRYSGFTSEPERPAELVNFGEAVSFPLLFGALLVLFGTATMVHLLLVSVARRRAETGLLKVIGFVRRQVAAAVGWQATTVTLAGLAAGLPLGIAAGRAAWQLFAVSFGVVPVPVVPGVTLAVLSAGVLAAANLLAVVPAAVAARCRPAGLLRAE